MERPGTICHKAWRQPFIGFFVCMLVAGLALAGLRWEEQVWHRLYFPGTLLLLPIMVIAFTWGLLPALVGAVLNTLVLDYLYLPPAGALNVQNWDRFFPFFLSTVLIALLVHRYEIRRQQTLLAQQREQQRANELEQADRLKDQFLAMASHELKTPLTIIRTQAQLTLRNLERPAASPDKERSIQTGLQAIEAQTRRLEELITNLLDLSTIRSGKVALHLDIYDLREICAEALAEQRLLTRRSLDFTPPEMPILLHGDKNRLHQAITNLLTNAIKYSWEESAIQVRLSTEGKTAHLAITNIGDGIMPEQQAHLFEPFYRTPEARKGKGEGVGLGLAIAESIVEQHHGRIWCRSTPGQETTYIITLPVL